jgi:hypothetical protein
MPRKKPIQSNEGSAAIKYKRSYMLREDTIQKLEDAKRMHKGTSLSDCDRHKEEIQETFQRDKKPVYNWFTLRVDQRVFKPEDITAAADQADLTPEIYCTEAILEKLGRDAAIEKVECAYLLDVGEEFLTEFKNNTVSHPRAELWRKIMSEGEPDE